MPSTFVLTGGGTGGHLTPGLAVAAELQQCEPSCRIVFVGTDRPLEQRFVTSAGFEHRALPVESSRALLRSPLRFFWKNWCAIRQARQWTDELQPTGVIGLGGFASVPVALSAARREIPTIILEQNAIPGRATRLLCRRVRAVCASFAGTESRLPRGIRVVLTGNPVRAEIRELHLVDGNRAEPEKKTLLILGGSQGAESLNEAMVAALAQRPPELDGWRIIHQTGPAHEAEMSERYAAARLTAVVAPFFDDMPARYASATLVVSRAGATTLAELACAGLPAILLPYPDATNDHQLANARVFEQAGAAQVIEHQPDPHATAAALHTALTSLAADTVRRQTLQRSARRLAHPTAAAEVANLLHSLI